MKNKLTLILILTLMLCVCAFTACNNTVHYTGIKVVYELEGGTYQNSTQAVVHYYNFPQDTENKLIKSLQDISNGDTLIRYGYDFDGWYRTKNVNGEQVTYSDKWNFDEDVLDDNGVTLYASWKKAANHSYEITDYDTKKLINSKSVSEGDAFKESYAVRPGYTAVEFFNENGEAWDSNFRHPGGENNVKVVVLVKYVVGDYKVIRTAQQLSSAVALRNNIYLAADVDMNGASLNLTKYDGVFLGNGHMVSNFTVYYGTMRTDLVEDFEDDSKKSLVIALFEGASEATVSDVNFTDVKVNVETILSGIYKIYVAPFAASATKVNVKNVTMDVKVTISKLPADIDADRSRLVLWGVNESEKTVPVIFGDAESSIENYSCTVTVTDNTSK